MQAKLAFKSLSFSSTLSAFLKFALGFIFVIMAGLGIYGALFAYLIFLFTPIVVGIFVMRDVFTFKNINTVSISAKSLISFGVPSAVAVFCLNSFISTDIILVKHLFSPDNAGLYAGLSLVGKIIFFITAPVMTVMFPIITNRFNRNEDHKNVLFMSMALVGAASLAISLFYFLFPKFTILFFLKRTEYLHVANYLGLFGIFITLYCIVSLLSYYFLSVKKTKVAYFLSIGAVLQAVLILIFHSDFAEVIFISIFTMAVLLLSLLYYYWTLSIKKYR
jgi:O-antigen/teichoic acid export membrane protein